MCSYSPFRYDLHYKKFFGFVKDEKKDVSLKMPLKFVWGVKPVDNGDPLDPGRFGKVEMDPTFDIGKHFTTNGPSVPKFCPFITEGPN